MSEPQTARIRCLSIHADYRCRDSGACCASGWPIPVEAPLYERLVAWLDDGSLAIAPATPPTPVGHRRRGDRDVEAFVSRRGLPEGAAAVLGQTADGRCVFHEAGARRCRIQRMKGHASLPMACQQFPRMCLIDPRGIQITLSHYCPTAADSLFAETPLAIVHNPRAFPPNFPYEGLDARDAFPPLLRPGVLMDWQTLDSFETHAVRVLEAETSCVELALTRIEALAERLREWRATDGALGATFERLAARGVRADGSDIDFDRVSRLDAEVRAAVPGGGVLADATRQQYERWVAPVWRAFTRPLCRYLAAKLFANWCWYQGQGLRTLVRALHAALAVLRVESTRQAQANGRMLDRDLLREAFRQTDLLLIHLCSQDALARSWGDAERMP